MTDADKKTLHEAIVALVYDKAQNDSSKLTREALQAKVGTLCLFLGAQMADISSLLDAVNAGVRLRACAIVDDDFASLRDDFDRKAAKAIAQHQRRDWQ